MVYSEDLRVPHDPGFVTINPIPGPDPSVDGDSLHEVSLTSHRGRSGESPKAICSQLISARMQRRWL